MLKGVTSVLILMVVFGTGCAPVRSGVFTVASTKRSADVLGAKLVIVKKGATGSATVPIVFVPFGVPRDYAIMEEILLENGGDVLTNVNITNKVWVFLFFGANTINITCDVWKIADGQSSHRELNRDAHDVDMIDKVASMPAPSKKAEDSEVLK